MVNEGFEEAGSREGQYCGFQWGLGADEISYLKKSMTDGLNCWRPVVVRNGIRNGGVVWRYAPPGNLHKVLALIIWDQDVINGNTLKI